MRCFFCQIFHLLVEKEYEQYGKGNGVNGPLQLTEREHHGQTVGQWKQHVSQQSGGLGLVNQFPVQEEPWNHGDKCRQDGDYEIPHRGSDMRG